MLCDAKGRHPGQGDLVDGGNHAGGPSQELSQLLLGEIGHPNRLDLPSLVQLDHLRPRLHKLNLEDQLWVGRAVRKSEPPDRLELRLFKRERPGNGVK